MSQYPPPYQNPGSGQPGPYGAPQDAQPPYGQPQYPQAYGQPQEAPPTYGQPQYPPAAYGQPQYAPAPYGASPYGGGFGAPPIVKPTGWFVVNWLFFWPIAIYSLVSHWNKIDPAAYSGDIAGAQFHAAKVKKLGILALCLGIGLTVLIVILEVAVFATVATYPYG